MGINSMFGFRQAWNNRNVRTNYFKKFGDVKEVCFVSNTELQVTHSCIVRMGSRDEVSLSLKKNKNPIIYLRRSELEVYHGKHSLVSINKKGQYKMFLEGLDVKRLNKDRRRDVVELLEALIYQSRYNRLKLRRDGDNYNGKAKIRFIGAADRQSAKVQLENINIKCSYSKLGQLLRLQKKTKKKNIYLLIL